MRTVRLLQVPVLAVSHDAGIYLKQLLLQCFDDFRLLACQVGRLIGIINQVKELEIVVASCLDLRNPALLEQVTCLELIVGVRDQ